MYKPNRMGFDFEYLISKYLLLFLIPGILKLKMIDFGLYKK
jgi:hypothetical protein